LQKKSIYMEIERLCISCRERLKGRPDKKFCSDQCRSRKNYSSKVSNKVNIVDDINRRLENNRDLLHKIYLTGRRKVARALFLSKGIDLNVFTQIRCSRDGYLIFYCYDFGYARLSESEFQIFKLTF